MISYIIPSLIAVTMFISLIKDWEQHRRVARWILAPVILFLVTANILQTWKSDQNHQSELGKAQKAASVQTDLLKQMQIKNQDLEAWIIAQDERTRALTELIPDPVARKKAQSIGPKFTRQAEATMGFHAEATVRVTRGHK
jgi:hypothetical protein